MKRILSFAAIVTAAVGANAQTTYDLGNFSIRGGVSFPLDSGTKDVTGNQIGLGLDYEIPKGLTPNSGTYFSIDWLGRNFSGNRGNIFPILINERFYMGEKLEIGRRKYWFAGVGVAFIDVTKSGSAFAARGGVGTELNRNTFAEAQFLWSTGVNDAFATGVGVYLGWRF